MLNLNLNFTHTQYIVELFIALVISLFYEREYRTYPQIKAFLALILLIAISNIFSIQRINSCNADYYFHLLVLRYITIYISVILLVLYVFKLSVSEVLIFVNIAYLLEHSGYVINEIFTLLISDKFNLINNSVTENIQKSGLYILVYIIFYMFFIRRIDNSALKKIRDNKFVLLISVGVVIVVCILSVFCHGLGEQEALILRILTFITCIMFFVGIVDTIKITSIQSEYDILQRMFYMKNDYYERLAVHLDETNIKCHDFKYQLDRFKSETPSEYIGKIENSIENLETFVKTSSDALNIVLTDISLKCKKDNITFTNFIDSKYIGFIENIDIFNLFGNALDNSIEAVLKLDDAEKRVIKLNIKNYNKFINIHIINYFSGEIKLRGKYPETTKDNSLYHGYGLKSIDSIVEKYDGKLKITSNNGIFDLNIIIPVKD